MKLAILMIFGVLTVSSAAEKWWKSALSDSGRLFSSLSAVNHARASSIILQLHGNVYPNGYAILLHSALPVSICDLWNASFHMSISEPKFMAARENGC